MTRRHPSRRLAVADRRANVLWTHWARRDTAGCGAILDEVRREAASDPLAWEHLVMALVALGEGIVNAATGGEPVDLSAAIAAAAASEATFDPHEG